jgi:hypothetical protein
MIKFSNQLISLFKSVESFDSEDEIISSSAKI